MLITERFEFSLCIDLFINILECTYTPYVMYINNTISNAMSYKYNIVCHVVAILHSHSKVKGKSALDENTI